MRIDCPYCHGEGWKPFGYYSIECQLCNGSGQIKHGEEELFDYETKH